MYFVWPKVQIIIIDPGLVSCHYLAYMNRLKDLIYDGVLWLSTRGLRRKPAQKKLLLVRVDEIGDYMLWRPFIREISAAFPDHRLDFFGNESWRSIFETFDADVFEQTYWMQKTRFKKDMRYRLQLLRLVWKQGYTTVINPAFSRDIRYDDAIVKAAGAPDSRGMVGNKETVRHYEKGNDRLYTALFDHPERPLFEFYRNKLFAGFLKKTESTVKDTSLDTSKLPALSFNLPDKYFVVFPGSRSAARIWPTENFIRTAGFIYEQYGMTAVVCGTNADAAYTEAFCKDYPYPFQDLTGKTSLINMLSVFKNATCLLSVDTGSVHMATAVHCPVFGIFNGSQYKRFAPYPKELAASFYAIYPDEIEAELQNDALVKQKYEFVVKVPYAWVKPEKLMLAIYDHFKQ
jgi:ADP-heptose:LPS heptosyltransferase